MENTKTFMLIKGEEKSWRIGNYVYNAESKCFGGQRIRKSGKIETFVVPVENVKYIISVDQ